MLAASPAAASPRVVLALSGGGARGIAHVGVLRAFEEAGIPVDGVAGTSMGAAIGALHATGRSAAEIAEIVRSLDWQEVFEGRAERPLVPVSYRLEERTALLKLPFESWRLRLPASSGSDYRINRFLTSRLAAASFAAGGDFDRLPVPFRAVAMDLATGAPVALARGSLDRAARASMSTPLRLAPVRIDERLLADGGLADNMPVDVAREMGADVVIAVDASTPPRKPSASDTAVGVGAQVLDVLARARNATFRREPDITVRPRLEGFAWDDYGPYEELMARGYEAGRAAVDAIRARIGDRRRAPAAGVAGAALEGRRIEEVTVEGVRHVQRPFALRIFGIAAGRPLRMEEMLRALDAVYATRLFASNWLEFRPGAGETVVVVLHVEEAPRRRLEAGAAYNESDRVKGFARVRDLNLLGWGERLELEGFASDEAAGVEGSFMGERLLGSAAGYLLQGRVLGERPRFFEDGQDLGRAGFHRRELAGVLQRQLGPALLVRAGAALGTARVGRRPDLPFGPRDDRVRMLRAAAVWDRLDDASLPTSGARVEVMADRSLRGLGATAAYSRLRARGQWVLSLARRSVLELRASMAVSGGAVPAYDLFRLGGPRELPGFRRDELWGAQAGAVSLSHSLTVARGLRLLVRGGAGDVWDSREQIALRGLRRGAGVGLELPTRAGPISLEWARRSGGGSAVYFAVGFE